jgi:plastocyanin
LTVRARRGRWATGLVAAAAGVAGLGPALLVTAQPAWAFAYNIEISDNAYSPQVQKIDKGDKVIWRMPSTKGPHSVTSDDGDFDYKFGAKGAFEELRFNTPGKYSYHCTYQNGMTGTIVVNDPDAPPPPTTTTAPPATTTTTARPTTTTTAPPTTTTAPPATTTTAAPRPPAEVAPPPVPSTAAAPPPTLATSSTTTAPPATTTTTALATTTSAPPAVGGQDASPSTTASAPPTTEATRGPGDEKTAAGLPGRSDGGLDLTAVALVSLLVAVGLFGAWTLIRVRPGRI